VLKGRGGLDDETALKGRELWRNESAEIGDGKVAG
jgi:hypothetical protein